MTMPSAALGTAAALDSIGRFVANVGVPAAITFFMLSQLTPRLDAIATNQAQTNTQLAVFSASCGGRPTFGNGDRQLAAAVTFARGVTSGQSVSRLRHLRTARARTSAARQVDRWRRATLAQP